MYSGSKVLGAFVHQELSCSAASNTPRSGIFHWHRRLLGPKNRPRFADWGCDASRLVHSQWMDSIQVLKEHGSRMSQGSRVIDRSKDKPGLRLSNISNAIPHR